MWFHTLCALFSQLPLTSTVCFSTISLHSLLWNSVLACYLCKRDFSSRLFFFFNTFTRPPSSKSPSLSCLPQQLCRLCIGGCYPACLGRPLQVCPAQPSEILLFNYLHSATQQAAQACVFWNLHEVEFRSWLSNNFSRRSGRAKKLILVRDVKADVPLCCDSVGSWEAAIMRRSTFSSKYCLRRIRASPLKDKKLFLLLLLLSCSVCSLSNFKQFPTMM